MNREFLKGLGLEDKQIDSIMAEHGKTIGDTKEQLETVTTEKDELAQQVENLNTTLTETSEKYADFDEQLANAQKELHTANVQKERLAVMHEYNVPQDMGDFLTGETKEDLEEQAKKLTSYTNNQTLPLGSTEPTVVDSEDAELLKMLDNLTNQN